MLIVLAVAGAAGGCFHSDAHRSGFTEDGTFWSERVADTVSQGYIDELRDEILALGDEGEVDPGEAMLLADTAVRHAAALAKSYNMVRPIEIHNALVNLGMRKRGLCYQCAEDLYVRLRDLHLKTLQLHWGVAHRFDMWLEHSGVIVTARGRPFSEGLVVDGWRHSGRLRWALVARDRYPWVKMFKRKFPELREEAVREAELAAARQEADVHAAEPQNAGPQAADLQPKPAEQRPAERELGDGAAAGPGANQRVDSRAAAVRAPLVDAPATGAASGVRGKASASVTTPPNPP